MENNKNQPTVSEFLTAAANILQTGGMVAGVRVRGKAHCALGALDAANRCLRPGEWVSQIPALEALVEVLSLTWQHDPYNCFHAKSEACRDDKGEMAIVASWSNNLVAAGSAREVIAGFRTVAAKLAEREALSA